MIIFHFPKVRLSLQRLLRVKIIKYSNDEVTISKVKRLTSGGGLSLQKGARPTLTQSSGSSFRRDLTISFTASSVNGAELWRNESFTPPV